MELDTQRVPRRCPVVTVIGIGCGYCVSKAELAGLQLKHGGLQS